MTSVAAAEQRPPSNLVGAGILTVWLALGVALGLDLGPSDVLAFAFVMSGWVLAVMVHEFAHAATAWLAGDHTVATKGYLAFDPRRYTDVGVSLAIPLIALALGGIGFPGGAVYLRQDLMRSRLWRSAASLAGPAATFLILVTLSAGLALWRSAGFLSSPLTDALGLLAFLQATALILNLLPIPGLDGFGAVRPFLPARWTPAVAKFEGLGILILLALVFLVPGGGRMIFQAGAGLAITFGLPPAALAAGWDAFHFWS